MNHNHKIAAEHCWHWSWLLAVDNMMGGKMAITAILLIVLLHGVFNAKHRFQSKFQDTFNIVVSQIFGHMVWLGIPAIDAIVQQIEGEEVSEEFACEYVPPDFHF